MADDDGFSYEPTQLENIVGLLRDGASELEQANHGAVGMVDAGASSQIVGDALANLLESSINTAHLLDTAAEKVHTANGAYGEIDNTAQEQLRQSSESGRSTLPGHGGPY